MYYPNDKDANIVTSWTRAGIGKERIANRLGCTVNQLEKTYPFELGYTDDTSLAIVADIAYQMASSGNHPTMTKWWLEVKGGWVAGGQGVGVNERKPLQILLDQDEILEGEYESMEDVEVLEIVDEAK